MMTHQLPKTLKWCQLLMSFIIFWCFSFSWSYFYLFFCLYFFCLFVWSLCILTHRSRSQSADSGNMYMMNWAATPAAQVPPHVHGDTTRGELLCRVVIYDTLLYHAHVNSLHRLKWVNSFTATSNVLSQCFICNIRTQQNTYWSYLRKVNVHMKSNSGMPTVLACSCNCI